MVLGVEGRRREGSDPTPGTHGAWSPLPTVLLHDCMRRCAYTAVPLDFLLFAVYGVGRLAEQFHHSRRNTQGHAAGTYALHNDAAGSDHGKIPDLDAWQDSDIGTNPHPLPDRNGFELC